MGLGYAELAALEPAAGLRPGVGLRAARPRRRQGDARRRRPGPGRPRRHLRSVRRAADAAGCGDRRPHRRDAAGARRHDRPLRPRAHGVRPGGQHVGARRADVGPGVGDHAHDDERRAAAAGGQHNPNIRCPYGVYETKDGGAFMFVVAMSDESWDDFWLFADRPEVLVDPRWNNVAKRIGARGSMDGVEEIRAAVARGVRQQDDRRVDGVPGHPAGDHLRADPGLRRPGRRSAGRGQRLPRRRRGPRLRHGRCRHQRRAPQRHAAAAACADRRRCSASTPPR